MFIMHSMIYLFLSVGLRHIPVKEKKGQKRTCLCIPTKLFLRIKRKNQFIMAQLSELFLIFVTLFGEMDNRHRGEQLCFNPSVNLENSL